MPRLVRTPLAVLLVAGCFCGTATASGFDVFGMGARGAAMGSAAVANAEGYAAVYYNPANMTQSGSTLGVGFMVSFDNARIRLSDRPAGYDIPDLGPNTPAIPTSFELRARRDLDGLDPYAGFVIGATNDLGFERFRVGVAAFVPTGNAPAQSRFPDERERLFSNQLEFDLLGDRIQHTIVLFGLAYRVLDWLSVGAGLSFMPAAPTNNFVYVPNLTDQSNVDLNIKIDIGSRFRPLVGILIHPEALFRIGIAFRDGQQFHVEGDTEVQVRGLQDQEDHPFLQDLDLTLQYSPKQFIWGGSYELGDFLLAADVTLSLWSDFVGAHGEDAHFNDTWAPRLGVEWAVSQGDLVRFGAAFEPTPVPVQTGRTNYVDNNRVVGSLGSEHEIEVLGSTLRVAWFFQLHWLLENSEVKDSLAEYPGCNEAGSQICDEVPDDAIDPATGLPFPGAAGLQTGNPGFPGYTSGGWVGAGGVEVSWEF